MYIPRCITPSILEGMTDTPIVMMAGARQTGKTTLAQHIAKNLHPSEYASLDDLTLRSAALSDPHGFLKSFSDSVVIDEIQLAPDLLSAIKLEVDRNRKPGRFLITGSANILTLPRISESLAGRMVILTLYPFSQGELSNQCEGFIDWVFEDRQLEHHSKLEKGNEVWQKIVKGGYPEIHERRSPARREVWFRDYVTTILQRDVRELSNIESITLMPRLLQLLATRLSCLLNFAELSRSMQIPQTSLKRYLSLFEATYLIQRLPPWSGNLGKRLVKAPKLYFTDVGLAANLLGADIDWLKKRPQQAGLLLENFVLAELNKQAAWSRIQPTFYYLRTQAGQKIDIILEDRKQRYVGIEVKATATVRAEDFKGLRWFANEMESRFLCGIVFYLGEKPVAFGDRFFALPVSTIWQTGATATVVQL